MQAAEFKVQPAILRCSVEGKTDADCLFCSEIEAGEKRRKDLFHFIIFLASEALFSKATTMEYKNIKYN